MQTIRTSFLNGTDNGFGTRFPFLMFFGSMVAAAGLAVGVVFLFGRLTTTAAERSRPAVSWHQEACVRGVLYLRFAEGPTVALDGAGHPLACAPSDPPPAS